MHMEAHNTERSGEVLSERFSEKNFDEEARTAEEIAFKIIDHIDANAGKPITILLPSRGANIHLISALRALREIPGVDEKHYADNIDLPPLICFDSIRKDLSDGSSEKKIRVLILPFTADATKSLAPKKGEKDVVAQMRESMAKFARELLFKPPHERNGPEFLLYLNFLEEVEGRKELIEYYKDFKPVEKGETVLMIDTVISGRACFNILETFENIGVKVGVEPNKGVDLMPILLVDRKGERLDKRYRKWVDILRHNAIFLNRLMAEDGGAAVLGVVSVIYQNLIEESADHPECGGSMACFGSWNEVPSKVRAVYMKAFRLFSELIAMKITGHAGDFDLKRNEFIDILSQNLLIDINHSKIDPSEISSLTKPGAKIQSAYETSSHITVINLENPKDTMSNICRKTRAEMDK